MKNYGTAAPGIRLTAQIPGGPGPFREPEGKTIFEQAPGNDTAALQNELGLGSHEHRSNLEHPLAGGKTEAHARRLAQQPHELGIRQRMR